MLLSEETLKPFIYRLTRIAGRKLYRSYRGTLLFSATDILEIERYYQEIGTTTAKLKEYEENQMKEREETKKEE